MRNYWICCQKSIYASCLLFPSPTSLAARPLPQARHFGAPVGEPPGQAFRRSVLEAAVGGWEDGAEHTYWYGFAATPAHELLPTQVRRATGL